MQGWYTTYLGRQADPAGLSGLVGVLQAGFSEETTLGFILGSQEYYNKAPARLGFGGSAPSDSIYVQALYHDLLLHSPGTGEVNAFVGALHALGRTAIVSIMMNSAEHDWKAFVRQWLSLTATTFAFDIIANQGRTKKQFAARWQRTRSSTRVE